jgi:uncharacterized protein YcbX
VHAPSVARISISPVKGLALVDIDAVELERTGAAANRRFHIVDADGRRYNQLRNGALVQIRQEYDGDRLTLRFPDGTSAEGTIALGAELTTDFYGRPVDGQFVGRQGGQDGSVDGRRFRMLFELYGCEPHEEDTWAKRHLRIGEALVHLRGDVGRCAITTQNPDTGVPDFDTLRTLKAYRTETANEKGKKHLPFGVYGEVIEPGNVAVGDPVEVVDLGLLEQTA